MNAMDLLKATVVCASLAFLVYTYPVLGQATVIALLSVVWLSYAYTALQNLHRK